MEPNEECTRFNYCSVNKCPLHSDYEKLESLPADKERRCSYGKTLRLRIAERYPGVLKYEGLTRAEWAGREKVRRMTDAQRAALRASIQHARKSL